NVLAISCHPDDVEIGCGGTLVKYAERGDRVTICHVANGNMGHVVIGPDELGRIRNGEARAGGALLGAAEVISMDVGDLLIDAKDQGLVRAMVEVIRGVDPEIIITHAPNDYMKDHVEVSRLAFDASFSATVPHFAQGAFTHSFAPIFYMDTLAGVNFQPEFYVDITGQLERKLRALDAHESQIKWMRDHDHIDFLDMVATCAKYRGYQCGVRYAEGFQICKAYPRMTTRNLLP
ncbi:MAG: PIG-L family deacetylase, partial [Clostridiales bacterium]|nr:PIG-L family deacetylase [Clostridiales bacterium]